jgi:DNA-damage-inducible protein J
LFSTITQEISHFELSLPGWSEAPSINLASAKKGRVGRLVIPHGKIIIARSKILRYNVSQKKESNMATTAMLHVRIDQQIKEQATETLAAIGLSVSDAVRVFLMRVVADKQIPFQLKTPNTETRAAMDEADEILLTHNIRFNNASELFNDLEKNSSK